MKWLRKNNQSNCRKAGPILNNTFGPGPTVILLIGPLFEFASRLLSRAGEMLQGVRLCNKIYIIHNNNLHAIQANEYNNSD